LTAIKANKNISTAPTKGNTMGMEETTSSTGSEAWSLVLGVWFDMVTPEVVCFNNIQILTKLAACWEISTV